MSLPVSSIKVKDDLFNFYEKQSTDKTADLNNWLNSGSPRIPQSKSYYYFEDRKISKALQMAKLSPGSKILEIGCNLGQMTFPLAQKGYDITGFDLSKNAIDKANLRVEFHKLKNIRFEVQDAEEYKGHKDNSFDAIFSFSAFRYFPNPIKALQEAFRVLKKDGIIVIDFPNKFCPWFNIIKRIALIEPHIHDNLYSKDQISALLRAAGFTDISFSIFLFSYKELPSFLLPLMKTADFLLEHTPVIRNTAAILMVKGKKV